MSNQTSNIQNNNKISFDINTTTGAVILAIGSNAILTVSKLIIGIMTNSIAIISEALHSGIDLIASIIAFFAVKHAREPADKRHQYGHGKIENVSSLFEAIFIFATAGIIVFESVQKLFHPEPLDHVGLGLIIMGVSTVFNIIVSTNLIRVGLRENSPALTADGHHLRTDIFTSLGVFLSLIIYNFTHLMSIDSIVAILIGLYIFKLAYSIGYTSIQSLIDHAIPLEEETKIHHVLQSFKSKIFGYHDLRTRQAGANRHVDLHLLLCKGLTIEEGHKICDEIEEAINKKLGETHTVIHVEPCYEHRDSCEKCSNQSVIMGEGK